MKFAYKTFQQSQVESPRQEDVECLIKLLNTIGSQLDENRQEASRQRMRIYFDRIHQLSRSPKLERRVQYALLVRLLTCSSLELSGAISANCEWVSPIKKGLTVMTF